MLAENTAKTATPKQKPYKLSDYAGLYLLVQPTGSRLWRLKYHLDGKEKCISLGVYPKVSLALARRHRDQVRAQLRAGIDPMQDRRTKREIETMKRHSPEISLSLSEAGELTLSTRLQFIHLSLQHTAALRAFLLAASESPGVHHVAE